MTAFSRRPLLGAAIFVIALIIWQGFTARGTPDPTQPGTSSTVAFMDIGVLVFREGLECILVLSAITASLTASDQAHRRRVAIGAGTGLVATLVTWFIAIEIVGQLTESVPALDLQAATGLVAVIVLLVIMNWFFHKIYWGGWIRAHTRRRKALFASSNGESSHLRCGLILLGFVLEVMVGEQAQEMQLAHWISRTDIGWLTNVIPAWMGMWFAVFPTYETMVAQLLAAILVVGSYYAATHMQRRVRPDNSYSAQATAPVRVFPKSLLTTNRWFSKTLPLFSRGEGFRSLHLFKRTD